MDYNQFFAENLKGLKTEGRYRVFADLARPAGRFPYADSYGDIGRREITVWCSNHYLGMGQSPVVLQAMTDAIATYGAGSSLTRGLV